MADALKDQGNKAFAAKDYDRAIALFSEAIKIDPSNHVLWSNRSAAYAGKKQWDSALEDAETVRIVFLYRLDNRFTHGMTVHKDKSYMGERLCS